MIINKEKIEKFSQKYHSYSQNNSCAGEILETLQKKPDRIELTVDAAWKEIKPPGGSFEDINLNSARIVGLCREAFRFSDLKDDPVFNPPDDPLTNKDLKMAEYIHNKGIITDVLGTAILRALSPSGTLLNHIFSRDYLTYTKQINLLEVTSDLFSNPSDGKNAAMLVINYLQRMKGMNDLWNLDVEPKEMRERKQIKSAFISFKRDQLEGIIKRELNVKDTGRSAHDIALYKQPELGILDVPFVLCGSIAAADMLIAATFGKSGKKSKGNFYKDLAKLFLGPFSVKGTPNLSIEELEERLDVVFHHLVNIGAIILEGGLRLVDPAKVTEELRALSKAIEKVVSRIVQEEHVEEEIEGRPRLRV